MKKLFAAVLLISSLSLWPAPASAATSILAERLKGYILLQVESHGEAWYVNPADGLRYYLADGDAAYSLMRSLSLGISNRDLARIPSVSTASSLATVRSVCSYTSLALRLKGHLLLQVESHGEAWYVDPRTCYRVYLKNGAEAYSIMRLRSLGITNSNLALIPTVPVPLPPPTPLPIPAPSPTPVPTTSTNPLNLYKLYINPDTNASRQITAWGSTEAANQALLKRIADQPAGFWFGDQNTDVRTDVDKVVTAASAVGAVPVLVAYDIPNRDCGTNFSAGGAANSSAYHTWISSFAEGIGSRKAIVILEPDAVALDCFNDTRGAELADAVSVLKSKPGVSVYIDAGHPNWTPAAEMATRLQKSGIANADGFALNVSNFYKTDENITFGNSLSSLLGGKHYVIDTGRNHNGWQGEWCNPQGAGLGAVPTTSTGTPLLDALLWVKPIGESDGNCNGGPNAGAWWLDYALRLVRQGQ